MFVKFILLWHSYANRHNAGVYHNIFHWFCQYILRVSVVLTILVYLTLRLLMSYTYGAPILGVSRSHTTTHHSR
jgi:hypothetical protein